MVVTISVDPMVSAFLTTKRPGSMIVEDINQGESMKTHPLSRENLPDNYLEGGVSKQGARAYRWQRYTPYDPNDYDEIQRRTEELGYPGFDF